jgi:hypothetical protein
MENQRPNGVFTVSDDLLTMFLNQEKNQNNIGGLNSQFADS